MADDPEDTPEETRQRAAERFIEAAIGPYVRKPEQTERLQGMIEDAYGSMDRKAKAQRQKRTKEAWKSLVARNGTRFLIVTVLAGAFAILFTPIYAIAWIVFYAASCAYFYAEGRKDAAEYFTFMESGMDIRDVSDPDNPIW